MPAGQPFTSLCRALAPHGDLRRADLHLHTTCSDGTYTPAQVVDLARRSGLAAIAVTDHDTVAGIAEAITAAGRHLEVIPGVEISTVHRDRELHLLAYFIQPDDTALVRMLDRIRVHRAGRFRDMVERLRECGVALEPAKETEAFQGSLGRRHVAELLVKAGKASTVREAFQRYLRDGGRIALPKLRPPVADAIACVRAAGGVASWAHPAYDCTREALVELKHQGLGAIETEYPTTRPARARQLRAWADELGLAVSGGSDCHGPEPAQQAVGARSITLTELAALRRLASSPSTPV